MATDLKALGESIARAKAHLDSLKVQAKTAAQEAAADGISEVQIHRDLGVDRGTVRDWLGKGRKVAAK